MAFQIAARAAGSYLHCTVSFGDFAQIIRLIREDRFVQQNWLPSISCKKPLFNTFSY